MESSSGTDSYTYNHTEPNADSYGHTHTDTSAFGYANADSEAQECLG
jgi:hypothetical protein